MDFAARTLTPPGYRTFVFEPHGHVTSTAVLIDPPEGAGTHPLPDWVDRVLADHFGLTPQERA